MAVVSVFMPESLLERIDEFAGAQSVALDAGDSQSVTVDLAFSRYDDGWTVDIDR